MRADVPPEERVVLDRARAHHLRRPGASRSPSSRSAAARRRAGRRGRSASAPTSGRSARPPRAASSRTARAAAAGSGGSRRRRRSPCRGSRSPTWTWVPKISSRLGDEAELGDELAVARRARRSAGRRSGRTGGCPAAPTSMPLPAAISRTSGAGRRAARSPSATSAHGRRGDLEHATGRAPA